MKVIVPPSNEHISLVPVQLPDGSTLLAEVSTQPGGDVGIASKLRFPDLKADIARVATLVVEAVDTVSDNPPERFGVEFGVKLSAQSSGLSTVLAQVSGEATFVVRMEWQRQTPGPAV